MSKKKLKRNRKAQITMEFVSITIFMMILFTVLFFSLQNRMIALRDFQNFQTMSELGNLVVNEVQLAARAGDGYSRTFYVPVTLNGEDYNVNILTGIDLVVSYEDLEYIAFFDKFVVNNINKGFNTITCCDGAGRLVLT